MHNTDTPRHTMEHLVMHMAPHDFEAHQAAARHPNTSGDMLDHLSNLAMSGVDGGQRGHRATLVDIVRNKKVNGGTLKAIYDFGEGRGAVVHDRDFIENPMSPPEVVNDIVKGALERHTDQGRVPLLRYATLHRNTSGEMLAAIHKEKPGDVGQALARHRNTPGHVLADLGRRPAHDHDLVQHPNTPSTTLHDIAQRTIQHDNPHARSILHFVKEHPSASEFTKRDIAQYEAGKGWS